MKPRFLILAAALPLAVLAGTPPVPATPAPQPMPAKAAEAMPAHVMLDAAQLQWGDAPPALERGAQAVVLSGDPGKPGWFALRLKMPAGFKVARHWHPSAEHVTVIEGDATLTMGAAPAGNAHTFGPGGYAVLPARMPHAASTEGGVIVQVEGMGPFEINYVDAKDDPRSRMPAAKDAGG